ncbi:hypothetical protein PILCRDRAFT_565 [Piloderma croceum F 1598]|uniref:Fungal calcium binding protein domain-containing protein n=1 Tax=Piloderma croceum (strain F 1598) TaxID=765440 RepID=A0A0C3CNP1_PILCF|nr:hypothetical protein PILCRDRAFT_565 [Piloderma croceum F 1598]
MAGKEKRLWGPGKQSEEVVDTPLRSKGFHFTQHPLVFGSVTLVFANLLLSSLQITHSKFTKMKPAITLIAAFAASTLSSPTHVHNMRSCLWTQCLVALSPAALTCVPAGIELGADFLIDGACLANLGYDVVDAPGVCNGCIGIAINSQGSTLGSIEGAVRGAAHKIAHALGF